MIVTFHWLFVVKVKLFVDLQIYKLYLDTCPAPPTSV